MREDATARCGRPLADLIGRLDEACAGAPDAMDEAVSEALCDAGSRPGLLSPAQCLAQPGRYARHLLHADAAGRYTVVAIVWGPGQFSPVHGHYTWCGYTVVTGRLREETYRWTRRLQAARLVGAADRAEGDRRFSHAGVEEIHRLGNPGDSTAVSVHVYGVDAPRVSTHVNRVVPLADAASAFR